MQYHLYDARTNKFIRVEWNNTVIFSDEPNSYPYHWRMEEALKELLEKEEFIRRAMVQPEIVTLKYQQSLNNPPIIDTREPIDMDGTRFTKLKEIRRAVDSRSLYSTGWIASEIAKLWKRKKLEKVNYALEVKRNDLTGYGKIFNEYNVKQGSYYLLKLNYDHNDYVLTFTKKNLTTLRLAFDVVRYIDLNAPDTPSEPTF
jgi:hypothetical protein